MRVLNVALALLAVSSASAFTPLATAPRAFISRVALAQSTESGSILTRLPDSAVELTLKIPGDATQAAYDRACNELSKTISIPGFRKGAKIPPQVLEQSMSVKGGRNALRVEAIQSLLSKLIEPALKDEHGLEPIGQPSLVVPAEEVAKSFVPGEPIDLLVKCDVWPEIQWKSVEGKTQPYLGLEGTYKRKPFNQEKFDRALNDLLERYATLEPAAEGSALAMGDACRVNMVGYMANDDGSKGEPLPNAASGDDVEIILGPGRYMTGLVEGLVGAKVGDERVVTVTFPVNLRDKTLAGKKAIFDVSILDASHRTLPEVTDEFANTALAEVMDVEVPDTLVTNQARDKFALMMTEMRDNGVSDEEIKRQINPENFGKYKDIVKDEIIRDFKISMATDEIARLEGIEVPDYQIEEQLQSIKKDVAEGEEFDETMIRGKVETTLQRQMVFDFLADQANLSVEYVTEEFDAELMQRLAQESLEREKKMLEEAGVNVESIVDADILDDEALVK
ncbi:peptidyl-prolyl cis-trans isomerase [Fragilaria crotonensis]|nr:peptidyl-prolyl cis-trans isomerase [Fragilaria crotonensis]